MQIPQQHQNQSLKFLFLTLLLLLPTLTQASSISSLSPLAHYTLDEESGVRYDSTTSSLDLTSNNSVPSITGVLNLGADFNGTNQYLSLATDHLANTWTITGWFEPDVVTGGHTFFSMRPTSGYINGIDLAGFYAGRELRITLGNASGSITKDYKTSVQLTADTTYFIAVTWDGTNLRVYFNGVEDTAVTKTVDNATIQSATTRTFRLGTETASGGFYDGEIDEVSIFQTALSSSTITTMYNSGTPLPYDEPTSTTTTSTSSVSVNMDDTNFLLVIIIFFLVSLWLGFMFSPLKKVK